VKTVAMESTGVYWIPLFEILEQRGFEVLLVNARNVPSVYFSISAPLCAKRHRGAAAAVGLFQPETERQNKVLFPERAGRMSGLSS
jgi:transposase